MPRTIRPVADLQDAAAHVKYEIDMLIFSAAYTGGWHSSPKSTPSDAEMNMALESFLLHYRNLRAFLCPSVQTLAEDDIIASDFLNEVNARDLGNPAKLGLDKQRLDGMLSHLTYRRVGYITAGTHGWDVDNMLVMMLGEIEGFLGLLPAAMVSWFPPLATLTQQRSFAQHRRTVRVTTLPGPPLTITSSKI
jgi:hypothetical protein